jgi:hypothetical protein
MPQVDFEDPMDLVWELTVYDSWQEDLVSQ